MKYNLKGGSQCGKKSMWKKVNVEKSQCGKKPMWKKANVEKSQCGKKPMWKKANVEKSQCGKKPMFIKIPFDEPLQNSSFPYCIETYEL